VAVLLQPAGRPAKLVVSCSAVAGCASSVVKVTVNGTAELPTTAVIWPVCDGVATTLSLVVAV
jgi:hypothetical protein